MTTAFSPASGGEGRPRERGDGGPPEPAEPIISVTGVSASIGGRSVLEDITFHVEPGRFVGIIGPNGAGKTTLLRLLIGLLRPERGSILVFGNPPQRPGKARHWIGYAPQRTDFNRWFPLSVLDVVLMGRAAYRGIGRRFRKEDVEAAEESLRQVGLLDLRNRPIGALSGGQQQRVFLARALAGPTRLLLLDEPSTGLDIPSQTRFYHLLKQLQEKLGLTIVTVSHDLTSLSHFADEFICINRRLYVKGTPEHVLASPELSRAYGWQFHRPADGEPVSFVPSLTPVPMEEEDGTARATVGEGVPVRV